MMVNEVLHNLLLAAVFSLLGVVMFALSFWVIDRITPYDLWQELVEKKNTALAMVVGAGAIALAIIIAAAITQRPMAAALLVSVLLIAACGLIYELVAGALASYLLGDSVTQFSTVIGTYLFAMGVGSYLSRYITRGLVARFVAVELLVAVAGGFSSAALFLAFAYTDSFRLMLYLLVILVGILVGLEIPLLMRILKDQFDFKDVVANVLSFDYLGALAASLLFPIVLVPRLGLVRSAMLFGVINAAVALWSVYIFRHLLGARKALTAMGVGTLVLLSAGFVAADRITRLAEENLYADDIIFARNTRYQRIVLTSWNGDLRLFLNSHLQFSSRDEYRYHEALVHPGLASLPDAKRVLVLGGGDGLAVREILKYRSVESVTLVDLDPEMTGLFQTHPVLSGLNRQSLTDARVRVINADAFAWLDQNEGQYDFIVADFPDPSNYAVGKLYSTTFYRLAARHLSPDGLMVIQSTSPLFAPQSFWCIAGTVASVGLRSYPYHAYVPSFGEWGYVLAGRNAFRPPTMMPDSLRFISVAGLPELFSFPRDMAQVPADVNRLDNQVLVRYYEREWAAINQ